MFLGDRWEKHIWVSAQVGVVTRKSSIVTKQIIRPINIFILYINLSEYDCMYVLETR